MMYMFFFSNSGNSTARGTTPETNAHQHFPQSQMMGTVESTAGEVEIREIII